jgi:hypothetical protein
MIILVVLIPLMVSPALSQQFPGMISGQVLDAQSRQPLPFCNIRLSPGNGGTVTDSLGLFALLLPLGQYELEFNYTGYKKIYRNVKLTETSPRVRLKIELTPIAYDAGEIIVTGLKESTAPDVQTIEQLDLRQMPNLYSDALRGIKVLPGVTSNNELTGAYNVRGGHYDENLIYLNGYQIYRPYLLRTGAEENQSLLNPDLTQSLTFYNGGFPARFGDRMSSVLEVDYTVKPSREIHGVVRGSLLNVGFALHQGTERLTWAIAGRYANPVTFLNTLQTSGDFRPRYSDIQFLLNYQINDNNRIELFTLYADNQFDLIPQTWKGNFKFNQYDIRGVDLEYNGFQQYGFQTTLLGLKWQQRYNNKTHLAVMVSGFLSRETEDRNLEANVYYIPDAREPGQGRQYLKTRSERIDNRLQLSSYDAKINLVTQLGQHRLQAGLLMKLNNLENQLDERIEERGDDYLQEPLQLRQQNWTTDFHQFEGYLEDQFTLFRNLKLNAGIRYLYYAFSDEQLLSPRISLHYLPSKNHILYLRWGYYYQPPYYLELKYLPADSHTEIEAQRAIQTIIGWQHQLKPNLDLQVELYYKKLNQLIPFYMEDLQIIYTGRNQNEGFARGFDILLTGELIQGMNSWISYGYLDTKERSIGTAAYRARLLNQTHTLRFFVQDKIPSFPHLQFHTRILFGSGYRYFPRQVSEEPQSGQSYLNINFDRTIKYPYYGRVDMGLSALLNSDKRPEFLIVAEVLNVFNNFNVLGYSWFQVFPDNQGAVPIPRILTKRFFNLGFRVSF